MKTALLSLLALGAFAMAVAPADRAVAEPFELNAAQMDSVTGGELLILVTPTLISGRGEIMPMPMAPVGGVIMIDLGRLIPPEPGMGMEVVPPQPSIEIIPPSPGFNG